MPQMGTFVPVVNTGNELNSIVITIEVPEVALFGILHNPLIDGI